MLPLLLFSFLILKSQNKTYLWSDIMKFIFLDLSKTRLKEILWSKNSSLESGTRSWKPKTSQNTCHSDGKPKESYPYVKCNYISLSNFMCKNRSQLKWNTTQCFTRVLELSSYYSFYLVRKQIYCFEIPLLQNTL